MSNDSKDDRYYGDYHYDKYPGKDYGHSDPCKMFRKCFMHVIQKGDTFYNLGQRYCVPVDKIMELNPCAAPKNLQIGQIVMIPCPKHYYHDPMDP